ncbi:polyprenyl synthetase family protein [Nitrosophilus kaiyonis]|uniref:polyprenyl synthetase family protein n=1 Tax=Nitrosophilus kaiyonis TaxID=2930200 RepID=UPI002491AE82|nr:polyprenyl synthetase family protein [Nitrosophilus kaiyonis]
MSLKENFEKYLLSNLINVESFHPYFNEALNYMLKAGGKRFRPLLLLNVVKAYEPLLLKNSYPIAAAIEFLHTYSLIHDDLPSMDNADLRRGYKTLHKKYDETTAILVGDALNTHSFYLISTAPLSSDVKTKLSYELSYNGGIYGMVLGQAIDCYFENKILDIEKLKFLHIHKTAKLIAASLKMGAIICEKDEDFQNRLYNFGIDLGLLFQIQDDLIDSLEDEKSAGKTTSNDTNKNSFVNLLGVDGAYNEAEKLALKLENELNSFDKNLKESLENLLTEYIFRHRKFMNK